MPKTNTNKQALEKELEERTTAGGLINYAWQYYKAYQIVDKTMPKVQELFPVKYFLLCRVLELSIKGFLRNKGYTRKKLMGMGHDLEKLIDELHKNDVLMGVNQMLETFVANQYYKTKQFEYPITGYKEVPDLKSLERNVKLALSMTTNAIHKLLP